MVNGKIIQGMTGCGNAEPGGCFITGHDIKTGEELWRVNTIAHPGDPNYDTWNGLPMESRFGASAWISGSYDPDQNLVFYGTGQPYPWIAEMRGTLPKKDGVENNALYSDSTLAIEPDTGRNGQTASGRAFCDRQDRRNRDRLGEIIGQRVRELVHRGEALSRLFGQGHEANAFQARIDALISDVAENWRLDRMAAIDRNILRLGAYEMLFCPDVPTKVAINEALELAKRYSTAQSSRFVNGILDRLQAAEVPRADPGAQTDVAPDDAPSAAAPGEEL